MSLAKNSSVGVVVVCVVTLAFTGAWRLLFTMNAPIPTASTITAEVIQTERRFTMILLIKILQADLRESDF